MGRCAAAAPAAATVLLLLLLLLLRAHTAELGVIAGGRAARRVCTAALERRRDAMRDNRPGSLDALRCDGRRSLRSRSGWGWQGSSAEEGAVEGEWASGRRRSTARGDRRPAMAMAMQCLKPQPRLQCVSRAAR